MMSEPTRQLPEVKAFTRINPTLSPAFANWYANNVEITTSYFDVALFFGEVAGVTGDALNVERKTRVVLPLGQAKLLAFSLIRQLATYETTFGTINLDPKVIPDDLRETAAEWESRTKSEG